MILNNTFGPYQGTINTGLQLAALPESQGGWAEYFSKTDEADLSIENDILRAQTAVLLENAKRWIASKCSGGIRRMQNGNVVLGEAVRSVAVGGLSDYIFPTIRASFANNPINEIVSTQPTLKRFANIFILDFIAGTTKGNIAAGTRLTDALGNVYSGFGYTSEKITAESLTALGSANATYTATLKYNDGLGVRPGSVAVTIDMTTLGNGQVFTDNGNGAFIAPTGATLSSSSINYRTGAISLVLSSDTFKNTAVAVDYSWNSEGSKSLPEIDVMTTSMSIETLRRGVKVNFSVESAQDMMAELGMALESLVVSGASAQLNLEIATQILYEAWVNATVGGTFAQAPTAQVTVTQYYNDLMPVLNLVSNGIESSTGMGVGNILIVDDGAAAIITTMAAFKAAPAPASRRGLYKIGTLGDQYTVYKFSFLKSFPGAVTKGNILMMYRGTGFQEAAVVWAPYQLLYTTDYAQQADFVNQKGFAHRSAIKVVNQNMLKRISIT